MLEENQRFFLLHTIISSIRYSMVIYQNASTHPQHEIFDSLITYPTPYHIPLQKSIPKMNDSFIRFNKFDRLFQLHNRLLGHIQRFLGLDLSIPRLVINKIIIV